jgi:hypothetical protein
MILLAAEGIEDYAAVQECDGQLAIHLKLAAGAAAPPIVAAVRASVNAIAAAYGCRPPQLDVDTDLPAPAPGRKRRRVQRL